MSILKALRPIYMHEHFKRNMQPNNHINDTQIPRSHSAPDLSIQANQSNNSITNPHRVGFVSRLFQAKEYLNDKRILFAEKMVVFFGGHNKLKPKYTFEQSVQEVANKINSSKNENEQRFFHQVCEELSKIEFTASGIKHTAFDFNNRALVTEMPYSSTDSLCLIKNLSDPNMQYHLYYQPKTGRFYINVTDNVMKKSTIKYIVKYRNKRDDDNIETVKAFFTQVRSKLLPLDNSNDDYSDIDLSLTPTDSLDNGNKISLTTEDIDQDFLEREARFKSGLVGLPDSKTTDASITREALRTGLFSTARLLAEYSTDPVLFADM